MKNYTRLVFAYGSLKEGFYNHTLLSDSQLIGTGMTCREFTMHDMGAFPVVTLEPSYKIEGELYKVTDEVFKTLNSLGCNRVLTPIILDGGMSFTPHMYYYSSSPGIRGSKQTTGVWSKTMTIEEEATLTSMVDVATQRAQKIDELNEEISHLRNTVILRDDRIKTLLMAMHNLKELVDKGKAWHG